MSRTKKIDDDTLVGYSYLLSKFYVTNKETTTYRGGATLEEKITNIQNVLKALDITTVTDETLEKLYSNMEELQSIQYTWADDGSYIKTIQINDYAENPITLDCAKQKLYVMNTNLIFDLTLTESKQDRALYLQSYFRDHFGIDISYQQFLDIYDFLIAFYKPCIYNYIEDTSSPLTYSNTFGISNYEGTKLLKAQYSCKCNPNNTYSYPLLGSIEATSENTITTTTPITSLSTNSTIKITGTTTTTGSYTLSADGEYTVSSIEDNTITTNESIPYSYSFSYPTSTYISSSTNILSINRETLTITLTNPVPNTISVGSIIYIAGTQQSIEGESVSCDGEYTVASIEGSTIVTQETIPTNYTYIEGTTYPTISKHIALGNISLIKDNTITFTTSLSTLPPNNSTIILNKDNTETTLTVITSTSTTIRVHEDVEDYTPNYPSLQQVIPTTDILITTSSSQDEDLFQDGEFMVDNFSQCQKYISTYLSTSDTTLKPYIPKQFTYNLVNKAVPTEYFKKPVDPSAPTELEGVPVRPVPDTIPMTLKGVYSQVYSDS